MTEAHVAFLPPGLSGRISSGDGCALLYGEIPRAKELDPGFERMPRDFRSMDWTREPVLDSEHDARKRIYLVTRSCSRPRP
jgi:hypothetical protein